MAVSDKSGHQWSRIQWLALCAHKENITPYADCKT
jgi:hypothetical protein